MTEKIVDDLIIPLNDNDLESVWSAWHPHRFAAVAVYAYLFVSDPTDIASRWNCMVVPKSIYIPSDEIRSLPMLASYCTPFKAPPNVDAVPSRVAEDTGQAIATPPVVCELCHQGFRCKEDLIQHCYALHGNYAEY